MSQALSTNASIAVQAMAALSARDFETMRALAAPDVVMEFPYHPNGPETHHGVDALIKQQSMIKVFETFRLDVIKVFDAPGTDTVLVEARSRGTLRSGKPDYVNHYIFALTIVNGKLTSWREFFNPLEAMKVGLGRPPRKEAT